MFQNISRACASLGTFILQHSSNHSMSLGRELLRYWLVMVQVSLMGSQATDAFNVLESLTFDAPLCNLLMAERAYVKYMFNDSLPTGLNVNTSKPFWGIALPAGNNSGEALTFVSTIIDCLDKAVPGIVRNLTEPHCQPHILRNMATFSRELVVIREMYSQHTPKVPAQCPKQITDCGDLCKKLNGLRILHYAKTWVQTFASCGHKL